MTSTPELIKLQQAVRESRATIASEYAGLISQLDIRKQVSESFRSHPFRWIGGAAAAGLLATLFGGIGGKPARGSKVSEMLPAAAKGATSLSSVGWLAGALEVGKLLYPVLRPVVVECVSNVVQSGLFRRSRRQ